MQRLIEAFMEQEKMYNMEGRRGVENLCKLVSVLGYKDPQCYGQLANGAALGDLVNFLEDNSGAIEAIVNWISERPDWKASISSALRKPITEEDE